MKEQDQIKAIAELDGWKFVPASKYYGEYWHRSKPYDDIRCFPLYLTIYDALFPVIQKQSPIIQEKISRWIGNKQDYTAWLRVTPKQLAESLLRATGKWVDND